MSTVANTSAETTAIVRLVRMTFTPEGIDAFHKIFESNWEAIRGFDGCDHLELLSDIGNPLICTTLSHWKDTASLERYRQSSLFTNVWSKVKPLFAERPQAYTMRVVGPQSTVDS